MSFYLFPTVQLLQDTKRYEVYFALMQIHMAGTGFKVTYEYCDTNV
jgi:hypothetical protein